MARDVLSKEVLSYIRPKYMSPPVLSDLVRIETALFIILDIKMFCRCR